MTESDLVWRQLVFFGNTLQDYLRALGVLIVIVLSCALAKRVILRHLARWAERTSTDFDDFLVSILRKIGTPTFLVVAVFFATLPLNLEPWLQNGIRYLTIFVLTIRTIILLQDIVRYSVNKSYRRARPDDPAATTVIKNITYIITWGIWVLGAVFILDNLGVNISALVAGLGIGGIAVAMASQAILGDLFSALSIFIDKPFVVGDFIIIDDYLGTVEYVGLKTTRVRSLHGELLIFANSDLTKSRIKNYKQMEVRRIAFKLGVVYQTSTDKAAKIPQLLKDVINAVQGVRLDRAHFLSFGDFALIYEIVYYVLSADYNIYMDKQQEINMAIKKVFEREQIEFAYPTQTLFVAKNS